MLIKRRVFTILLFLLVFFSASELKAQTSAVSLSPANKATAINPDTRLTLTFSEKPKPGNSGQIRIYDLSTGKLVDMLDLGIPPGPKNTRTPAPYDSIFYKNSSNKLYTVREPDTTGVNLYQKNYIGGNTEADAYHFYPVLIHGNTATIYPHNNHLDYNKTYYVQIDPEVFSFSNGSFLGISSKTGWTFSTKKTSPPTESKWLVVSADGKGDFNTVQAAVDFIPEKNPDRKTIFIKNGIYEEIVYFRNKMNISFIGEDREKTIICYANNGVFNGRSTMSPDPALATKYHNQRAVFAVHNSNAIHIANLTLKSLGEAPAQAEALLILGKENIVSNTNIDGSGDALQATGTIYITGSRIQGYGDNVLGYGAVFFNSCDFVSTFGPHLWVRNTQENRGNVLLNCRLSTIGDVETVIARAPNSNGKTYPYCEAVLINCSLEGIRPEGWGKTADITDNIHYWEYNSTNSSDGKPVDISSRHPASRQLTMAKDSLTISNYKNPAYVLEGWSPALAPYIISQPLSTSAQKGQAVNLQVVVTAIPDANYQWFKDGKQIDGATNAMLKIDTLKAGDAGNYYVIAKNNMGQCKSEIAILKVK
jgi:pectin methylesterase-like acyl-CoA thioesterase